MSPSHHWMRCASKHSSFVIRRSSLTRLRAPALRRASTRCLPELPADVEPHEDTLLVAAARELARRRVEVVAEIELQDVAVRHLLDAGVPGRTVRFVAREPRRGLEHDVRGRADADPRA